MQTEMNPRPRLTADSAMRPDDAAFGGSAVHRTLDWWQPAVGGTPDRAGIRTPLRRVFRRLSFLVLLLAGAFTALADTVTLRTGERLAGKVVAEKRTKLIFESEGLGRVTIPRKSIERIQRDETPVKLSTPPPVAPFKPPPPAAVSPAPTNAPAAIAASTNTPPKRRSLWLAKLPKDEESSDWIQLKSGEWLRGRLYGMQNRKFEFESDELDDLSFDWTDIWQVQSPQALVSYGDRQAAAGALRVDRDTVTIAGVEPLSFPRADLIGIAPGQPRELDYWSGKLNVGVNLRSGNTEQSDVVTTARLERRTPSTHLKFNYTGNFSELDGVTSVENQRLNASFYYFLSRRLFLVMPLAESYRDPFQNIGRQLTIGGGGGYYIIDRPKVEWLVLGGPAYQNTRFDTVQAGESIDSSTPAVFLQSRFDVDITKRISLEMSYQTILSSEEAGRATHHSSLTLEIDLTRRFDLDVSFIWDRTEKPQADSSGEVPNQNDFRLNLSLGVKF